VRCAAGAQRRGEGRRAPRTLKIRRGVRTHRGRLCSSAWLTRSADAATAETSACRHQTPQVEHTPRSGCVRQRVRTHAPGTWGCAPQSPSRS
jgi:hypothetical protein